MRLPTVLVVEHGPSEPVARLGGWLADAGLLLDVRRPYATGPLPPLTGYAALLVMGGSMGPHDDERAPWLPDTRDLLRDAVRDGLPVLGVCLGAQLLAVALGGRVGPAPDGPEIGPGLVAKRDVAAEDRIFRRVPFTPDVLQWHFDVIAELPPGATGLATSNRYPHQAFRVGERAWGVQFHIETTPQVVRGWAAEDALRLAELGWDLPAAMARWDLDGLHEDLAAVWEPFAGRFAEVVRGREHQLS
ncbi:MAG: type 1 glutamine amidotransferase [Mycobacteriales bacterium]